MLWTWFNILTISIAQNKSTLKKDTFICSNLVITQNVNHWKKVNQTQMRIVYLNTIYLTTRRDLQSSIAQRQCLKNGSHCVWIYGHVVPCNYQSFFFKWLFTEIKRLQQMTVAPEYSWVLWKSFHSHGSLSFPVNMMHSGNLKLGLLCGSYFGWASFHC